MDLFKFPHWDSEQDVLVTDARPLLAANHPIVAKTLPWAYAINTAQGFFSMGSKKVVETESIDLQNGKKLEVTSTFQRHTFLCTDNTGELYPFWHSSLSEDVWVWSTDYFDKFLIVTFLKTNQTVLIDSRGIPYELPISGIARYHRADVQIDKRRGCYVIEKTVSVKYRSSLEQAEYDAKTKAEPSTVLNKEFRTFCRRNAKNNQAYLYLTVGQ